MTFPGYVPKKDRTHKTKTCKNPLCNKQFNTTRDNKLYHTNQCRIQHWMSLNPRMKLRKKNEHFR